jgi:hypothetical protein
MEKELTLEKQLRVLEMGLRNIKNYHMPFVCVEVSCALREVLDTIIPSMDVQQYIPILTFENAQLVCRKYKLKMPNKENESGGWWDSGLLKPRLAFVNWMIAETKAKIKAEIVKINTIEILVKTKMLIATRKETYLCNALKTVLFEEGIIEDKYICSSIFRASDYIPLCTIENATIACAELRVTAPWTDSLSWWNFTEVEARIAFIDWMIAKLKNK